MTGNAKDRRRARRARPADIVFADGARVFLHTTPVLGIWVRPYGRPPREAELITRADVSALTITIGDADEPLPRDDEGNIMWPALPDGTVLKPVLTIETTAGNISELGNKFWCGGEPSRECACDVCMYEAWKGPEEP